VPWRLTFAQVKRTIARPRHQHVLAVLRGLTFSHSQRGGQVELGVGAELVVSFSAVDPGAQSLYSVTAARVTEV